MVESNIAQMEYDKLLINSFINRLSVEKLGKFPDMCDVIWACGGNYAMDAFPLLLTDYR